MYIWTYCCKNVPTNKIIPSEFFSSAYLREEGRGEEREQRMSDSINIWTLLEKVS